MNVENILNNKECKLIFLKAIILGINYGKSDKANYYLENIEKEISRIKEKNEMYEDEIIKKHVNINEYQPKQNISSTNDNQIFKKSENIILQLENQKKYTINLIQTLSSKNYAYNYSKINLLKNNLLLINYEIDKNKIIIKKINDQSPQPLSIPLSIPLSLPKSILKKPQENTLVKELEKTLGNLSNMLIS
jgi:hypothetical protein